MSLISTSCAALKNESDRIAAGCGDKVMTLTENGKAKATIVVAADAPYKNQLAAKELKHFLDRISGADFVIKTDDQKVTGPKILVGRSRYTEKMKLDIPSGQSYEEIKEGFIVKTVGKDLVLAGNDDGWRLATSRGGRPTKRKGADPKRPWDLNFGKAYKGTLFAVYAFLEQLGCRWYMPGKLGEVVPSNPNIAIGKLDMFERPGFLMRGYWLTPRNDQAANELDAFFHRNRFLEFSAGFSNAEDSSIHRFITNSMFKDHPEYFGLLPDGKGRDIKVICMTHPEVEEILVKKIREFFKKNPDVTYVGFAPHDGMFICYCPNCLAANGNIRKEGIAGRGKPSVSGSYYRLISNVAARLKPEFPDKIISASIYCGRIYTPPTEFKFADNVGGHLALLEYSLVKSIDNPDNWQSQQIAAMFKAWKRRMDKFIYRPYYPNFMFNMTLPIPQMHNIIRDVKFLAHPDRKPLGMRWECRQIWNLHFLNIYMLGKMLWNPDGDGEKLLDEAYSKLYGPAARPVKKFYTALENAVRNFTVNTHEEELIPEIYNYKLISSLMPLIDEAEKLTADVSDDGIKLRMKMLRVTADHIYTYSKMRGVCELNCDYAGAAKLAEKMQKLEAEMMKLSVCSFTPGDYRMDQRPVYGKFGANRSSYGKMMQYRNTDALRNGTEGTVAVDFPRVWKFKTDKLSLGIMDEWFRKDLDISGWKDIQVPRAIEMQGYFTSKKNMVPYLGEMYYATDFELDAKFDPDKLAIYVGGINNEAWIWINGQIVAYQPFHSWWSRFDYTWTRDLPAGVLKPGKNRIVVRVIAMDKSGFGGIFRNMFLYQKK